MDSCLAKILKESNDTFLPFSKGNFYGRTVINFYVLPTGDIRKLKVTNSTGSNLVGDAVIDAVVATSPCNEFSKEMAKELDFLSIAVSFDFGMKRNSP